MQQSENLTQNANWNDFFDFYVTLCFQCINITKVGWKARRNFLSFLLSSQAPGYLKEQLLSPPSSINFFCGLEERIEI